MIADTLDNIDNAFIIIYEPIKNSIIQYSNFYKIAYSNHHFSLNGLYAAFNLTNYTTANERCTFNVDMNNNKNIIKQIINLEEYILGLITSHKPRIYKLKSIISSGYLKYNNDTYPIIENNQTNQTNNNFILKISGIWETTDKLGLTFKIIMINKEISLL